MVAAGAERFFAAQRESAGVHQIAEIFPARRHLVARQALRLGDQVDGGGGGHRASKAYSGDRRVASASGRAQTSNAAASEIRDALEIGADDGQRVRGAHEEAAFAENHVTILKSGARRLAARHLPLALTPSAFEVTELCLQWRSVCDAQEAARQKRARTKTNVAGTPSERCEAKS